MQHDEPSIFDQDFFQKIYVSRQQLMPLALKFYVWAFLVASIVSVILAFPTSYTVSEGPWIETVIYNTVAIIIAFRQLLLGVLYLLSSTFILFEKKFAILFALVMMALAVLSSTYSLYRILLYSELPLSAAVPDLCWLAFMMPYIVMLLKIKKAWENIR